MTRAEAAADRLRSTLDLRDLPIPVEQLAVAHGVAIERRRLAPNVSGLLLRGRGSVTTIVVNETHSAVRQRFTVAHELGHLLLHKGRPVVVDQVRLNLRDDRSSVGVDTEEIEANAFAAELLMPRAMIVAEVQRFRDAPPPTRQLAADLARGFDVSPEAMQYRLVNLGLAGQV